MSPSTVVIVRLIEIVIIFTDLIMIYFHDQDAGTFFGEAVQTRMHAAPGEELMSHP